MLENINMTFLYKPEFNKNRFIGVESFGENKFFHEK